MTIKTTLFKALKAANAVYANGFKVKSTMLDEASMLDPYVDLVDGSTIYLANREIQIDDEGRAYSLPLSDTGEPIVWSFRVIRAMTAADLE